MEEGRRSLRNDVEEGVNLDPPRAKPRREQEDRSRETRKEDRTVEEEMAKQVG